MFFSVIVPVYNRPDEIRELLDSLADQTYHNFEILIIEDGSDNPCKRVVELFDDKLNIQYYYKENSGQGFSRNYGFERAEGDFLVVFDSDCIIPPHYFETVRNHLHSHHLDAYGGPDRSHQDFTPLQKAIGYSMTSPFTTGGIRGNEKHAGTFHPRSFNMGISKEVFTETGGYRITRMGEDIEFSIRIIRKGFRVGLIPEAFVYHKRRTSLVQFYRQLHFFGRARVNVGRFYPDEIKLIHLVPAFFTIGFFVYLSSILWYPPLFGALSAAGVFGATVITADSTRKNRSIKVGLLSSITSFVQIFSYGMGVLSELWVKGGD